MTPQNVNNCATNDPMDSEGAKTSVSELKRMMVRMIVDVKEVMLKNNEIQQNMNKQREDTETTKETQRGYKQTSE